MTARRELVLDAMHDALAALLAVSPTVVDTVERDRSEPMTPDLCPALVLHTVAPANLAEETDDHARFTMRVVVEGYVVGATEAALMPAAHELLAWAKTALYADRTLGGVAFDVTEQDSDADIDREQGHAPMGHFSTTYRVDYQTAPGDPFTAPA